MGISISEFMHYSDAVVHVYSSTMSLNLYIIVMVHVICIRVVLCFIYHVEISTEGEVSSHKCMLI